MTSERAKAELTLQVVLRKKIRYSHLQNEQTERKGNNPPEHMNGCDIQVPTLGSHHCIVLHIGNQL